MFSGSMNGAGRVVRGVVRELALIVLAAVSLPAFADVASLSVKGNRILAGGEPASFAGNSLFWSNTGWGGEKFYTAGAVKWLKADWKTTIVRAAMGVDAPGGYLEDPEDNLARVRAVVDAGIANDLYVIIDWHSHRAERHRGEAVAFFERMAREYGSRNHVIYEIYNEPLQISWSGQIKPYAVAVIAAIRAIDPDNLIVVGTPSWSQDVDSAAADPIAGTNIAYALHFYAGTHGQSLRNKAQKALDLGAALFVTEWGSVNANGDGAVATSETTAWMQFLKARGISHLNWAVNDKNEGASALVPGASPAGSWPANQLTPSGAFARQIISGWGAKP
jgi:endoglucanase